MSARIVFRVDSSLEMGTGHLMRCLTLARALRKRGAECQFITRCLPGHVSSAITDAGFLLTLLPPPSDAPPINASRHGALAGVDWHQDAKESRAILLAKPTDWLVVDHYAFDLQWENMVCTPPTKLLVIDDLADRPHSPYLLLDQNLGRKATDYAALVPSTCRNLVGTQFALLRPEFAQARDESLAKRENPALENILISMGGTDSKNATGLALNAIAQSSLTKGTTITVVMGKTARYLVEVCKQAENMPFTTTVKTNVRDMTPLMIAADLAIGAAGGSAWERCCLGLPTLTLVLAGNQRLSGRALALSGSAVMLGEVHDVAWGSQIARFIGDRHLLEMLKNMSRASRQLVDGRGCERVVEEILGVSVA